MIPYLTHELRRLQTPVAHRPKRTRLMSTWLTSWRTCRQTYIPVRIAVGGRARLRRDVNGVKTRRGGTRPFSPYCDRIIDEWTAARFQVCFFFYLRAPERTINRLYIYTHSRVETHHMLSLDKSIGGIRVILLLIRDNPIKVGTFYFR